MKLKAFNALNEKKAAAELARCCGASKWVAEMAGRRPFPNKPALFESARLIWKRLGGQDWKEAFDHHPKIGDSDGLKKKFAKTAAWAAGEQSGAAAAPRAILQALSDANSKYEDKFGYIFIVCATGKSAGEMLALLNGRMGNTAGRELKIAAAEQTKITLLRLEKLLS